MSFMDSWLVVLVCMDESWILVEIYDWLLWTKMEGFCMCVYVLVVVCIDESWIVVKICDDVDENGKQLDRGEANEWKEEEVNANGPAAITCWMSLWCSVDFLGVEASIGKIHWLCLWLFFALNLLWPCICFPSKSCVCGRGVAQLGGPDYMREIIMSMSPCARVPKFSIHISKYVWNCMIYSVVYVRGS